MHLPSPEAVPSLSGRGGLPTPSSTALLLKAAADAVRDRWWTQGATLGNEQAGRCNRRTGGGSSCPPRQDVLDRLSLLLCSQELLGHVTGCVAEEASLGYRNRTLSASLCQPDTARGGAPGPHVWREARIRIVTTPVHVPQCF